MNSKNDIVKSNALIEAAYNPGGVNQMRLLLAALMQLKSADSLSHTTTLVVTANALQDLTNTNAKNAYRDLKNAANELMSLVITVHRKPNGDPREPSRRKMNVVSACDYFDDEGLVKIEFTHSIIPYISELKNRFTKYQAQYVMPMKSSYGIRLYELCLSWMGEEREFLVDDFKRLFGIENQYKEMCDLKKRVIEPALSDINTYSDIRVKFGQRKTGRRVTHFQFIITRPVKHKRTRTLSFDEFCQKQARKGESWNDVKRRLSSDYLTYKKNPYTVNLSKTETL